MFSKQLIDYTESTFKESKIDILTKTMVKEVKEKAVVLQMPDKSIVEVPCGLVVWAAGNKGRKLTQDLMAKLPNEQKNRRGIEVDDFMRMKGANGVFAIGDCTATSYAPTAQAASQQGAYLARILHQMAKTDDLERRLNQLETLEGRVSSGTEEEQKKFKEEKEDITRHLQKVKLRPFHYSHQGSLAYIGSDKAIADLPFMNGNVSVCLLH
jgi:NADH:ubiquinone reductase (non-electrogenic)